MTTPNRFHLSQASYDERTMASGHISYEKMYDERNRGMEAVQYGARRAPVEPSPCSFDELENAVYAWGWARGIIQNGKPMGQAIKTLEETTELLDAINKGNLAETKDAIGDVLVTLIMVCGTLGIELTPCLELAYAEIKDRKGFLTAEGVFIKEPA
jgi:hypothetical protein